MATGPAVQVRRKVPELLADLGPAGASPRINRFLHREQLELDRHKQRRRAARLAVARALAAGEIEQLPCQDCGRPSTQAHHRSYDEGQELQVRWLCSSCHRQRHLPG